MEDAAIKKLTSIQPYSVSEPSPYEAALTEVGYKQPKTTEQEKYLKEKAETDINVAREKKRLGEESLKRTQEIYERPDLQQQKLEAFTPSQETGTDLAKLFALTTAIAFIGGGKGRYSGMTAMNNLASAMEGYRKGRKDLFAQEMKEYDKNVKAAVENNKIIQGHLEKYLQLAAKRDANAATELEVIKALTGRQGALADIEKLSETDKAKFVETLARSRADWKKHVDDMQIKNQQRQEATAGKSQVFQGSDKKMYSFNPYSNKVTEIDTGGVTLTKPGARGTTAGQNALTFASRVYSNIENAAQDLKNISAMPATSGLPIFSGLLNVERDSALKSVESLVGRKITKAENRAFQQVSDQLGSALARLESQGLASGSTKANIASFNSLRPGEGDDAINMALYLARVKQEIETGIRVHDKMPGATEEQKQATKDIANSLDDFVPFNTDDVLRVLRKNKQALNDKMSRLVQQPAIAPDLNINSTAAPVAKPTATSVPKTSWSDADEKRLRELEEKQRGAK